MDRLRDHCGGVHRPVRDRQLSPAPTLSKPQSTHELLLPGSVSAEYYALVETHVSKSMGDVTKLALFGVLVVIALIAVAILPPFRTSVFYQPQIAQGWLINYDCGGSSSSRRRLSPAAVGRRLRSRRHTIR